MTDIQEKTKRLVISLIKDDLIHTKLINGLHNLRINAEEYNLKLPETIFHLMGFPEHSIENDAVFEQYFEFAERVRFVDIQNSAQLNKLAKDLYEYLEMQQNCMICFNPDKQ